MQPTLRRRLLVFSVLIIVLLLAAVLCLVFLRQPYVLKRDQYTIDMILEKMHQRTIAGVWSGDDERLYKEIKSVTPGLDALRNDSFTKDSSHYASVINNCKDPRRIAAFGPGYILYGEYTNALSLLPPGEIIRIWREKMHDQQLKVSIIASPSQSDPRYFLKISSQNFQISLSVDAVSGQALGWPGDILEPDVSVTAPYFNGDAKALLKLLLDEDASYEVTQEQRGAQKDTYLFYPLYNGYRVRTSVLELQPPILEYYKETGQIVFNTHNGKLPSSKSELGAPVLDSTLEDVIKFASQTQQYQFNNFFTPGNYELEEIAWLYCSATCTYELAYFLKSGDQCLAIFANSGLIVTPWQI